MIYRSKGERRQIAGYYEADLTIDLEPGVVAGARERGPALHAVAAL